MPLGPIAVLTVLILVLTAFSTRAEPPRLVLSLEEAQAMALTHSPILKAAQSDMAAAQKQVEVQLSMLLPRVTLDGSYFYQTIVPQVSLFPGSSGFNFGTHNNYAVGPTVSYTLWDQGELMDAWRSQKFLASSQAAQKDLARRQVILIARLDYFQVQLALEQELAISDSLRLIEAQYRDITKRFHAGSASQIDRLSTHDQVLDRRRDLRSSQADVASALRTLFALTGQSQDLDVSAPIDARIAGMRPSGLSTPTISVELDPLDSVEVKMVKASSAPLDPNYPQVLVYKLQAEAGKFEAASIRDGEWPKLKFAYKGQYLYPELPLVLNKSYWQNTASLNATVPILEFGRTKNQAAAQKLLAEASESQSVQALDDLLMNWHKAHDQYSALRDEEQLDQISVAETAKIATLRYASYKYGGSTILDVETADINALGARVSASLRRTQILIQLATLSSLSEMGDKNER